MITLLVKASISLAILWLFYKLFLERESFFAANRLYLMGSLIFCFVLPFIPLPELVEDQGMIAEIIGPKEIIAPVEQEGVLAPTVEPEPLLVVEAPPEPVPQPAAVLPLVTPAQSSPIDLEFWLLVGYFFGLAVFALRLLSQLGGILYRILSHPDKISGMGYSIVNAAEVADPCSFFRYIFINPTQYDYDTYEQILSHEKIHIQKRHSIDLLLAELAMALLWFNPLIWLYRKDVEKNIEFQTDDLLISGQAVKRAQYQMNLLKVATYQRPLAITTNYNQSLLKQRIHKMSAKKSNPHSYWKYAFILPVLFTMLLLMNKPTVSFAQRGLDVRLAPTIQLVPAAPVKPTEEVTVVEIEVAPEPALSAEEEPEAEVPGVEIVLTPEVAAVAEIPTAAITELEVLEVDVALAPAVSAEAHAYVEPVHPEDHGEASELVEAASRGDLGEVKYLLSKGADINGNSYGVGTALTVAADRGDLRMMKYLLFEGADIDLNSYGVGTPLIVAVENQDWETVRFLISRGADLDVNSYGVGTALITAQRNEDFEMTKYLLSKGADLDVNSYGIGTALIYSVRNGDVETVNFLLSNGANPDINSYGIGTPLIAAMKRGDQQMIRYLLSQDVDLDINSYGIGTPLIIAAQKGNLSAVRFLLSNGADVDGDSYGIGTPLIVAAKKGNTRMVEFLLDNGAEIDQSAYGVGTALIVAVRNNQYESVKTLLDYGADPFQTSHGIENAFFYAQKAGNQRIMDLLENNEERRAY